MEAGQPVDQQPEESPWKQLHVDIFVQIAGHLSPRESFNPVQLVCKHWHALSKENPPRRKRRDFYLERIMHASFLHMVARIDKCMETAIIHIYENPQYLGLPRAAVSQLLSVLAVSHPQLREVGIQCSGADPGSMMGYDAMKKEGEDWENWAGCLPLLNQLESLTLLNIRFIPWIGGRSPYHRAPYFDRDLPANNFFANMPLKELNMSAREVRLRYHRLYYCIALGEALRALTQLTKLYLDISHHGSDAETILEDRDDNHIAENVCRLPNLRVVILHSSERMVIGPQWSGLTNMSELDLMGQLERCHNIAHLPALQIFCLHYLKPQSESTNPLTPLALESLPGLKKLSLQSTDYVQQDDLPTMLPGHALAGLTGLDGFTLSLGSGLTSLEHGILDRMRNLTVLSLAGNALTRIPPSMSTLSSLQIVSVKHNPLQLTLKCFKILAQIKVKLIDEACLEALIPPELLVYYRDRISRGLPGLPPLRDM